MRSAIGVGGIGVLLLLIIGGGAARSENGAGAAAGPWLAVSKGLPAKDGLGETVVVTNLPKRGSGWDAVKRLAKARNAKILPFREGDIASVRRALASAGPEFVTLAVTPETVDMNFQLEMLELCRNLDPDPMPDFCFGYLVARDGDDLAEFVDRTLAREAAKEPGTESGNPEITAPGSKLAAYDYILHFGHGKPWQIDGGLSGEEIGEIDLPRGPVVWSGACFTGVLSRSYHRCAYEMIYMAPQEMDPAKLVSLNWVHAGVTGYFAALEGDRGEMAVAEWEHFRRGAGPLGDAITHQYRLAFTSLPADYAGFPRYVPGARKRMGFYDVMLRGMISRILIGDPAFRPLGEPLQKPAHEVELKTDADARTLTVRIRATRATQGVQLNYLPKSGKGNFDQRMTERVRLPDDVDDRPGDPVVTATRNGKPIELTRFHVRNEVWGGARWLNLQAESEDGNLGAVGCEVTFEFPLER